MDPIAQPSTTSVPGQGGQLTSRGIAWRLFFTCWVIFAFHFSPYVVRELYLTMNLAEKFSVRVDEYADLHPDLFQIPGRGAFLGNNPGMAFLAAVPYGLLLPIVNRVAPVRAPAPGEEVSAQYSESRHPSRIDFYRKVRERGLDIRLGVAAMITSVFFMAPLVALSAVVMFRILGRFGFSQTASMWLALLYGLGTPVFFRAGTMNQNLLVGLLDFYSFALVWREAGERGRGSALRYGAAGFLAGYAVFSDYTGVVGLGALGLFLLWQEASGDGPRSAFRKILPFILGALVPIGFLLLYQWHCFGSPWYPAQFYMPKEIFRGYPSSHGFGRPQPAALWGLLFDPLYGLFVFAPILALAFYHPALVRRRQNRVSLRAALFVWVFSIGIWVFCSSIDFTLRHQWQDGVRYMAPVVPFLFLLVADGLIRMPRAGACLFGFVSVLETWCLAMVREAPWISISRVFTDGLELPSLTTLMKVAPQYLPGLSNKVSPLPFFVFLVLLIWALWQARGLPGPAGRTASNK